MTRPVIAALLAWALVGVAPAPSAAQDAPVLTPGARIRWRPVGDPTWYTGTVLRAQLDTVVVQPAGRSDTLKMRGGDLIELNVSRRRASRVWAGAGIGFLAGATGAFVAFLSTGCSQGAYNAFNQKALNDRNCIGLARASGIIAAGTVLGAIIGSRVSPETWVELPLTHMQATLTNKGVGLAIAF